jgi:MFS transporter, DHA2 family, multidrug resistance protein
MNPIGARKWWALGAITLAVLAVSLDVTVLSVALPSLATSLKASESDLQWFSAGYALILAAMMLPSGVLGDRFGRKRILLAALVLFGAGSIACAYSTTPGEFIAARVVLGGAGAAIIVMALSSVTVLFSEEERPRAVGVWGAANFIALPIGPILGGWLLTNYWWGWIFLMNVPVALIGILAVIALLPESRSPERPALDPIGMVTACSGLAGLTYGLIELGRYGWTDPASLAVFAGGMVLIVAFFWWERYLTARPGGRPLIDLALFRSRGFTWGVILAAMGGLALFGLIFTLPQYTQGVLGLDAMHSGVWLLPAIVGMVLGGLPAFLVAGRIGAKLTVATGFAITAAGLLVGATTSTDSSTLFVAGWIAVTGFGTGVAFITAAGAALKTVPAEKSGVASALVQAVQKVGAPLGAAIFGSVLVTFYQSNISLGALPTRVASAVKLSVFAGDAVATKLHAPGLLASVHEAFIHGMDAALTVSAISAALAMVLALAFLPGRSSVEEPVREPVGVEVGHAA